MIARLRLDVRLINVPQRTQFVLRELHGLDARRNSCHKHDAKRSADHASVTVAVLTIFGLHNDRLISCLYCNKTRTQCATSTWLRKEIRITYHRHLPHWMTRRDVINFGWCGNCLDMKIARIVAIRSGHWLCVRGRFFRKRRSVDQFPQLARFRMFENSLPAALARLAR
jgi:hypothetical protein